MSTDKRPRKASRHRRKRVWLVMGLVGVGALAFVLIPDVGSSQDNGPRLTYTVRRGDLIVTVIEQGTLESAENTEIKCKVRDEAIPITWVIEAGSEVKPGDVLVRLAILGAALRQIGHRLLKTASTRYRSGSIPRVPVSPARPRTRNGRNWPCRSIWRDGTVRSS